METAVVSDQSWDARMQSLLQGEADVGWICGVQYAKSVDAGAPLELLAAPVMAGARYDDAPVYFSDVVVRCDSTYQSFADLRGARWLCNEPNSFSGYHIVRHALAQRRLPADFFGSRAFSGAHNESVRQVIAGTADASAIDSTVLEALVDSTPALMHKLRVIDTLGPNPRPPWVIGKSTPVPQRAAIRRAMLTLHESPDGAALLAAHGHTRFAAVTDRTYHTIRSAVRLADARGVWIDH
jgi:phosphonate transport system substrate-binding protein